MSLSTADLGAMRDAQEALMPDTCVIQRATSARNAIGEAALTWAAIGTTVCRLRPPGLRPDVQEIGGQAQTVATWVATLPHDQTVDAGDRLVISGITFEVTKSWGSETWATALRVELKELDV